MMTSPSQRYDDLFRVFAEWDRKDGKWIMRPPGVLDWRVLKAQAIAESSLEPRAVSPVGAKGLFQFMDPTWKEWSERKQPGAPLDPFNPEANTWMAACYVEWLLGRYSGDYRKAMAAYNFGPGNVSRLLRDHGEQWERHLPLETSGYLAKVLGG